MNNDGAEQVFGHMKDRFFRGSMTADSFEADLDICYVLESPHQRRQVKLKDGVQESVLRGPTLY